VPARAASKPKRVAAARRIRGTIEIGFRFCSAQSGRRVQRLSRILLIEDDQNVRMLMEHVLLGEHYEVETTGTLASAQALIETHDYDLIVADGRLPDGTGMTLADQARERGIPALIVTAYAFELMKEDLGRFDFLLKPVRPEELLQAVERALDRAKT
jgi:DNA-binding NtrC family response regulator